MTTVEQLVSLIGSNPMSAFGSIVTLEPRHVTLVHTEQSKDVAERLIQVLDSQNGRLVGFAPAISLLEVPAARASEVRSMLEDLTGEWCLDYTGGTKAMSCGARLAYENRGPRGDLGIDPSFAYYVDDSEGCLRNDLGEAVKIREDRYSLAAIAALHGASFSAPRPVDDGAGARWEQHVGTVIARWLKAQPSGEPEVLLNPRVPIGANRDFEVDVLIRRGRRIGLISCYAGREYVTAKLKLFEAIERARQVGGDLARVAIAAPLDEHQARQFDDDLGHRWTPNRARLFTSIDLPTQGAAFDSLDRWWDGT